MSRRTMSRARPLADARGSATTSEPRPSGSGERELMQVGTRSSYLMIGGFLGAGKTTAILKLARHLTSRGLRVGLITNDQSIGLVDTAVLRNDAFPVEEITGGCFCCRFNSLVEASEKLSESTRPDVFIAEPVGSCTDLIAAVSFPLRKIYGDQFRVSPLSVLVDPIRAERLLGLAEGNSFSPKVRYIYGKQLEEAELIVINKCDLLSPERQDRLEAALRHAYRARGVLRVSARNDVGMDQWLDRLAGDEALADSAPEVDYEVYADGESLLGWLNVSVFLRAATEVDGNELLRGIAERTREALRGVEIAHLKMTLIPDEDGGGIGGLNFGPRDGTAEPSDGLNSPSAGAETPSNLAPATQP